MIEEKLKQLVIENALNADIDNIEITENTSLIEELQYDSVDLIQLITDIEKEFNIEFSDTDMLVEKIGTIGQLSELILEILGE